MSIYTFRKTQFLKCTLQEAWAFFSDPKNLNEITPDDMSFEIIGNPPEKMYAGLMIQYRVKPLLNIPMQWLTEITQVQEPFFFIDEQRVGPYSLWHHQHHFKAVDGGIEMEDIIHYRIPFAPLSNVMNPIVKNKLNHIFEYRTKKVDELFNAKK
jgi:ligand-binding SRPBCC domain-containing protein